ncbi:MAG: NADH-quinone oxidoreductase subunit H [Opitutales bacterium]|nr:NADH-quinone oxidoreductase subunit H [Opitutales bacterium]
MDWIQLAIEAGFGLAFIIVVMSMAGLTVVAERKFCGFIQGRLGPNRTTIPILGSIPFFGRLITRMGLFQLVADGSKFLFKEEIVPGHVNKFYYNLAPIVALIPPLVPLVVLPFGQMTLADGTIRQLIIANVDIGMLVILAFSSLGVYGTVLAGWAANSKYPFMGGIRASAQMISYELTMGLSILPVFLWANVPGSTEGLSIANIVVFQQTHWFVYLQPLTALLFLVALFAETNRAPFDMAESETDLVGGFHTEYGAFKFGIFFVSEYAHVIVGSGLFVLLFLGGSNFLPMLPNPWPVGIPGAILSTLWFIAKTSALVFFFIWIRWTLPRFRYDQVMNLGWKMLLPVAIANLVFVMVLLATITPVAAQ